MKPTKFVSHQSELYSILYELCKMMHAYALKQIGLLLCSYNTEDRPVRKGGPSAVQARDEFQKYIGSVWNWKVNCGPSGGEWRTVRRRKFWGPVFVQRLGVGGHDSLTVRP